MKKRDGHDLTVTLQDADALISSRRGNSAVKLANNTRNQFLDVARMLGLYGDATTQRAQLVGYRGLNREIWGLRHTRLLIRSTFHLTQFEGEAMRTNDDAASTQSCGNGAQNADEIRYVQPKL
jgi:hypothetical protein